MENNGDNITYFAESDYRGRKRKFGIKPVDRSKHFYVIGKTGMGKSTLLENMAAQDIMNGHGMAFIDPHGSAAEVLLEYVPKERLKDVIYFAPFDTDHPIAFNVMEDVGYDKRHLVVSGLMSAFQKIWQDMWSARMSYILQNALLALLEYPGSTLLGVNRMLIDKNFRKEVVSHITDPIVKSFWADEFANYTDRYTQDATPAIQNKIGQFVSNPLIRNIIGQPTSSFDFRKAMDEKKILIMNLSKGRMGDTNTQLIGSMLIIKIYLAAMSRADSSEEELKRLPPFYFFVDEFQAFANETFADILSESRKYKLNLTIAHQYIEQMEEAVRDAVFGNVGTIATFRVGAYDAEVLEKEFAPTFEAEDLVNLGVYQIYLKLMIDGLSSKPFSALTLPPLPKQTHGLKNEIIAHSRATYGNPRVKVEESITKWHEPVVPPPKEKKEEKAQSWGSRPRDVVEPASPGLRPASPKLQRGEQGGKDSKNIPPQSVSRQNERRPVSSVLRSVSPKLSASARPASPKLQRGEQAGPAPRQPQKEAHQPFKKALTENSRPKPPVREKAIPLSALENKNAKNKTPELPSKNKESLKEALANALGDIKKTDPEVSPKKEVKKQEKSHEEIKKEPAKKEPEKVVPKQEENKKIPEIPEAELRDLLHVEKTKKQ